MKRKKAVFFYMTIELVLLCAVLLACGGSPAPVSAQTVSPPDELDAAIRETSDYLNKQLPKGNKLMILNVQSDFPALSEYIIDELIANTVNDRVFSVVDRQQLNTIRVELDFQMSGEVDDATAQSIGRMAGAQIIISGAVSRIGDLYRLRFRALSVQSAQIEGQFNRNIPDGRTVSALVNSKATGYGNSLAIASASSATRQASSVSEAAPAPVVTSVPVPAPIPEPSPAPVQTPVAPATMTYKIGDTGPAGGIIFYDKGNNSGGWRYLEAAPSDLGKAQWQSNSTDMSGTKENIGSGKQNTQLIGDSGRAALLCQQYNRGGYQDWFLPSKAELDLMYINLKMKNLGNFSDDRYWSSTQGTYSYSAWAQQFNDGLQESYFKNSNTYMVRACRQF